MTERDLDVQGRGDDVADEDEDDAVPHRRDAQVQHAVAEPGPEEDLAGHLEPAMPPGRALARSQSEQQVFPAQAVQVEAAKGQDRVIQPGLVAHDELGKGIVLHDAVVVGRAERGEEAMGDGEEGHLFDVRIVLGRVGDDVVHVVAALPPAEAEAAEEIGDDDADDGVDGVVVCDAHVSGVVRREDQLMPEQAQKDGAEGVPAPAQEIQAQTEQDAITGQLDHVHAVIAVVEPLGLDPVVQAPILTDDSALHFGVERGILGQIECDLFLRSDVQRLQSGLRCGQYPCPGERGGLIDDDYLFAARGERQWGLVVLVSVTTMALLGEDSPLNRRDEILPWFLGIDDANLKMFHPLTSLGRMEPTHGSPRVRSTHRLGGVHPREPSVPVDDGGGEGGVAARSRCQHTH